MTLLQHHILALTLTAITTFGLGLLVFLADPKKTLNRVFAIYSISIAWWSLTECLLIGASSRSIAQFWALWEWIGVSFIAPTFLHTILLFTGELRRKAWGILTLGYCSGTAFVLLHLLTDVVTHPPRGIYYTNYFGNLTPAGYFLPVVFLFLVNFGLFKLWRAYRSSTGQRKTQIKFLFWGSFIGYIGGSADWALTFGFSIPTLNPFGIYAVPLYSIATTYAIFQHKLFDFNLVIQKSLVYSVLVTILTIGYFGLIYVLEKIFQTTLGYESVWTSIAAFALMALVFQPLKIGTQRIVDWLIFRTRHEELISRMERLEREAQQTEKLKAVSTLAAGLCHELRNPLQAIQTHAEFLPERYDDPRFREQCSKIMKTEITRINDLLNQLMNFAKPKQPAFRAVEPHKILDSILDFLNNEFVKHNIQLEKRYKANGVQIQADPDQLRQVILNLTLNALHATGRDGRIIVTTYRDNGWFACEISDSGPGIDPKMLPKLFEPFNSSKPGGIGLGLSIVHSIIREHRGNISVQSKPGEGATFIVKLPSEG